jgi:hypothetical protein
VFCTAGEFTVVSDDAALVWIRYNTDALRFFPVDLRTPATVADERSSRRYPTPLAENNQLTWPLMIRIAAFEVCQCILKERIEAIFRRDYIGPLINPLLQN